MPKMSSGVILMCTAGLLLAPMRVDGQKTPREFFQTHGKEIEPWTDTYMSIGPNVPEIARLLGRFQKKGGPIHAGDLDRWAEPNSGPEIPDLPLVWNVAAKRFVVRERGLQISSEAVVNFSWLFLWAYDALDKTLRESGSALAIGMASLVASQVAYRTNWAYLPSGLHDAAAMTNFILLGAPELVESSMAGDRSQRNRLVEYGLRQACPDRAAASPDLARRLQDDTLFATGASDRPAELTEWRRACGQELSDEKLGKINNLTIRALALERPPIRFPSDPTKCPDSQWGCRLRELLDALEKEQKPEKESRDAKGLAPDFRDSVTNTDPTVLIPLLVATTPFAFAANYERAKELMSTLPLKAPENTDTARELVKLILKSLNDHPATQRVLSLAGSPPEITIFRTSEDKVATAIAWRHMARIKPRRDEPRTEQVYLELVDVVVGRKTNEAPSTSDGGGKKQQKASGGEESDNSDAKKNDATKQVGSGAPKPTGGEGDGIGGKGPGTGGIGVRGGTNPGSVSPPFTNPSETLPGPPKTVEPRGTDPIRLSPAARQELTARTSQLRRSFEAEQSRLELPRESRLLAYLDSAAWRQGPGPAQWLPKRFEDFLVLRTVFLETPDGPFASRLADILQRELFLAAWLWEVGASSTADLLLLDLVEFAVYAGTEPGPGPERLWKLDLPLVFAFPSLVHGQPAPATGALMRLGRPANEAINNWSPGRMKNPIIGEDVSLSDLYAGLTKGIFGREPYLRKLGPFGIAEAAEWRACPSGRLCRWFFHGEGLRQAPAREPEKHP